MYEFLAENPDVAEQIGLMDRAARWEFDELDNEEDEEEDDE